MRRWCWLVLALCMLGGPSVAADYPTRPVTIIVPFPPGGGVDAMARVVADKLSAAFKQQFVVDNRGGAGGTLGTRAVKTAAPDGYTLLLGHTARSRSIRRSIRRPASIRKRILKRSASLPTSRSLCSRIHPFRQDDRRIHRARQKESRQAQCRNLRSRHRRLHDSGAVQIADGHGISDHSLQGHCACHE